MPKTLTRPEPLHTDAERLEFARAVWLKILEAARRLRPMVDHLFGTKDMELYSVVASAALDSWEAMRELYDAEDTPETGLLIGSADMDRVEDALYASMTNLVTIATLAWAVTNQDRRKEFKPRDLANGIEVLVRQMEERIGGDWHDSDASLPATWAARSTTPAAEEVVR